VSDAVANVVAHELAEAVSDPDLNAWWVSQGGSASYGDEVGDLCAWNWVNVVSANSAIYNVTLGSTNWLLQSLWVNSNGGKCVLGN
jgi:hypothetical protein